MGALRFVRGSQRWLVGDYLLAPEVEAELEPESEEPEPEEPEPEEVVYSKILALAASTVA